jgi:ABC-type dipeptide/oligopeptide/nickel transport system permease component
MGVWNAPEYADLSERIVIYRDALNSSLIAVVTIIGVMYGVCLTGVVLTESIFSWAGSGDMQ